MQRNKNLTVRTVYLYVATLVGLGLIIAGGVQSFELLLKATVLPQADAEENLWVKQPPMPYALDKVRELEEDSKISEEELIMVRSWLQDYERWSEEQADYDPVTARRQRRAATALSLLFVGIPVYLYHWLTIRRELKSPNGADATD